MKRNALGLFKIVNLTMICCLFIGCIKKYERTIRLCDSRLYLEVFNVNPAGVDSEYLTDSTNFRIYIGRFDNEHEFFKYQCRQDSVYILKIGTGNTNCKWVTLPDGSQTVQCDIDTLERKTIRLYELRKKRKWD